VTRDVGILWENAACAHLQQAGLQPLARNFNCRYGEIDLIMLDENERARHCIVFVEVRYRQTAARGDGVASVGAAKRQKLLRSAAIYLQAHPRFGAEPCRFDVVACQGTPAQPQFEWIRAAFAADS
jgi:putative endonuclease